MTAKAIETKYAGCRFRSRLEARWAVFFDAMGIEWEYEVEGFLVGPKRRPYLPDFWLPEERVWVEVKGSDEQLDIELLVDAAFLDMGLPSTGRMTDKFDREVRMVVLGPISKGTSPYAADEMFGIVKPPAWVLMCGQGEVIQTDGLFEDGGLWTDVDGPIVADSSRAIQWRTYPYWHPALTGFASHPASSEDGVNEAFQAACSARFEFGESGAPGVKPSRS
jgi:hypothetical protein